MATSAITSTFVLTHKSPWLPSDPAVSSSPGGRSGSIGRVSPAAQTNLGGGWVRLSGSMPRLDHSDRAVSTDGDVSRARVLHTVETAEPRSGTTPASRERMERQKCDLK